MSPSEVKGLALGIKQTAQDRHRQTFAAENLTETRVVCKFEIVRGGRRHQLTTFAKSRAGAWRAAVRWLRLLENGKLR